jgi:hypothetical protein
MMARSAAILSVTVLDRAHSWISLSVSTLDILAFRSFRFRRLAELGNMPIPNPVHLGTVHIDQVSHRG